MTTRKSPDLTNYFSGAKQSQQLSEAEAEIQRLKAEIEELRSQGSSELETQLQTLRVQLQSQSGIQSISLEKIQANPEQPRQTFLSESIESMSRSLVSDGQLEPIILIQREHLVIFDGERRWRSAKNLGWENLQAVIIPEPDALHRKALITSLHREDLNPLDKAEAIVRELAINTGLEPQDIPRILSTVVRRLNAQKRMNSVVGLITVTPEEQQQGLAVLDLDEREAAIFTVLLDLQLNPASIDANIFPMLSLAEDLKTAIRSSGLKGVHAIALQKLSTKNLGVPELEAEEIRINVTHKVLAEKLSVQKTRQLVTEAIALQSTDAEKIEKQVKPMTTATRSLYKVSGDALKKVEVSQLMEFQEVLRKKLAEIEEVIQEKAVNDNKV
jgi:ParB family chromosome partitioning protein